MILFCYTSLACGAAAIPKQKQAQKQKQQMLIQEQKRQFQARQQTQRINQAPLVSPFTEQQNSIAVDEVQDIVDMSQLLDTLANSSQVWSLIIDQGAKEMVVQRFIDHFHQHSIAIRKPAAFYAQQIDSMSQTHPEMLQQAFPDILQTVAIIEYDFNNGQNKDAMALKVLGQEAFLQNKRRLGLR